MDQVHGLPSNPKEQLKRRIGRYAMFGEIASGGMATVYFGRLVGAVGFSRAVAIKQLHPQYAKSPEFVAQFLDEAQLTARIRHPNVISVLDVVTLAGELFVVMEFVEGEPLSRLARVAADRIPIPVVSAIMMQVLLGLHAAHEATSEDGAPLQIVHRDVSPHNVMVAVDGTAHLLDFGIAKAASRLHTTETGKIKGKIAYMAPEQMRGEAIDRRVDVFAAGIVLWELLTGARLFARGQEARTIAAVLSCDVSAPRLYRPDVSPELEAVVLEALSRNPEDRFATAKEMAIALEACSPPASSLTVSAWVESIAGDALRERAAQLRQVDEHSSVNVIENALDLQRQLSRRSASAPPSAGSIQLASAVTTLMPPATAPPAPEPAPVPPPASPVARSALPWGAGLGALAVVLLLVWVTAQRRQAELTPLPRSLPSPSARVTATATGLAASPAPRATEPAAVEADDLPAERASEPLGLSSANTKKAARHPHSKKGSAVAQCDPPYERDPDGRKRFKQECF